MHPLRPLLFTIVVASAPACAPPQPAVHASAVGSTIPAPVDCIAKAVAERESALIRRARTFDGADLPGSVAAMLEVEQGLAVELPSGASAGGVEARTAYATERAELRREAAAKSEALARLGRTLRGPWIRMQGAVTELSAACASKKRPWCETAAQITGSATWTDERSIATLVRGLDGLTDAGKPVDKARAVATAAREMQRALGEVQQVREAAGQPLAHRSRALETGAAWADTCAGHETDRVAPPRLVIDKGAELRRLTVIVEALPPRALAAQFQEAARGADSPELATLFAGVAAGRTGSGATVVVDRGGTRSTYVVTNRHVVDHANELFVVLEDGARVGGVEIVHIDARYDLAILEVPGGAPLAKRGGFALEARNAKDGEPIVATGYPGLLGRPSFQTTRGHVSNERLVLHDEGGLVHVQHTAPIDAGSSGGPLTTGDGRLLGINTFKLVGRDGVAMAVPVSAVTSALNEVVRPRRAEGTDERAACLAIVSELAQPAPRVEIIRKMLGSEILSTLGVESHDILVHFDPDLFGRFKNAPVRTLSEAVARRIVFEAKLARGTNAFEVCAAGTGETRVIAFADGTTRTLKFSREHGRVALMGMDLPVTATRLPAPAPASKPAARPRARRK